MSAAHHHLLTNHVPVVGIPIAVAVLGWGIWARQFLLQRAGLVMLTVLALRTVSVYLTGEPAEEIVEHIPGVSESLIEAHETAALVAFVTVLLVGMVPLPKRRAA